MPFRVLPQKFGFFSKFFYLSIFSVLLFLAFLDVHTKLWVKQGATPCYKKSAGLSTCLAREVLPPLQPTQFGVIDPISFNRSGSPNVPCHYFKLKIDFQYILPTFTRHSTFCPIKSAVLISIKKECERKAFEALQTSAPPTGRNVAKDRRVVGHPLLCDTLCGRKVIRHVLRPSDYEV